MIITVTFYSYFKELTGTSSVEMELPPGTPLGELHQQLMKRFPRLGEMRKSTLIAVGVEYQGAEYALKPGDDVSLFPPVQGG